jgi:hypothetical protein
MPKPSGAFSQYLEERSNTPVDGAAQSRAQSRRRRPQPSVQDPTASTEQPRPEPKPEPQPVDSLPLKMRPRTVTHPMVAEPLPTAHDIRTAEPSAVTSAVDVELASAPHGDPSPRLNQQSGSKRERILAQTRRAAATEAKSIADQKVADEKAAKRAEIESEALQNTPPSIWSRLLGR